MDEWVMMLNMMDDVMFCCLGLLVIVLLLLSLLLMNVSGVKLGLLVKFRLFVMCVVELFG